MNPPTLPKQCVLLLVIQNIQVFTYQTMDDLANKVPYKEVYWQDTNSKKCYGPYDSIFSASYHYTPYIAKPAVTALPPPAPQSPPVKDNVIYVDFLRKKRII